MFGRVVDVTKLREDLLLKLERERSEEVAGLRSKQKQVGAQTDAAGSKDRSSSCRDRNSYIDANVN